MNIRSMSNISRFHAELVMGVHLYAIKPTPFQILYWDNSLTPQEWEYLT